VVADPDVTETTIMDIRFNLPGPQPRDPAPKPPQQPPPEPDANGDDDDDLGEEDDAA
jgi:hypothetical protein